MIAVVELWVVLMILCVTTLSLCLLICKIWRMDHRLESVHAKMKIDHEDTLRVSRELNTIMFHHIPTTVTEMSSMAKNTRTLACHTMKIVRDVKSLQRCFVDLEMRTNNMYMVVMNTPVDAAQSAVLRED